MPNSASGVGRDLVLEHFDGGVGRAFIGRIALRLDDFAAAHAFLEQTLDEAANAVLAGRSLGVACDHRKAPGACRQEGVGDQAAASRIVAANAGSVAAGDVAVEQHDRDAAVVTQADHARRQLGRRQDDPVDLIFQDVQDRLVAFGARLDREDQQLTPLILHALAECMQHVDIEGIGEIAQDQRHDVGALGGEAAGDRVGHVVELARRLQHLQPRICRDPGARGEGARHHRLRNSRKRRHVKGCHPRLAARHLMPLSAFYRIRIQNCAAVPPLAPASGRYNSGAGQTCAAPDKTRQRNSGSVAISCLAAIDR